jgi:uncharacterized LabA/DUF88 family protein
MKVAVFMDWQNVYRAARDAFELQQADPARGNFDPLAVGQYLAGCNKRGHDGDLVRVEIHRGLPSNPKGQGAAQRQKQAWLALDPVVSVKLRPVSLDPQTGEEKEKGIDVALACSAMEHVLMEQCDVAVVFSHDSDLLPPVETICRLRGSEHVETASWQSDFYRRRIPPAKQSWGTPFGVVNNTLNVDLFDKVETPVDYTEE